MSPSPSAEPPTAMAVSSTWLGAGGGEGVQKYTMQVSCVTRIHRSSHLAMLHGGLQSAPLYIQQCPSWAGTSAASQTCPVGQVMFRSM